MIYLEDYIDAVESLPDSLQRLLTTLHDLDAKVHHPHQHLVTLLDTFTESHASLSPADRALLLQEIESRARAVLPVNEERALVAMAAHHAVNNHIARANDNYVAFCSELWSEEQRIERKRTSASNSTAATAEVTHHHHQHQIHVDHPAKAKNNKNSSSSPSVVSGSHNARAGAASANAGTPANKRSRRAVGNPDLPHPSAPGRNSPHAMHPSGAYPPPPPNYPSHHAHPHAHHIPASAPSAPPPASSASAASAMRNSPAPTAAAALAAVASSASSSRNPTPEPAVAPPKRGNVDKKPYAGTGSAKSRRAIVHDDAQDDDDDDAHQAEQDAMQVDDPSTYKRQQQLAGIVAGQTVPRAGHSQRAAAAAAQATTAAQMAAAGSGAEYPSGPLAHAHAHVPGAHNQENIRDGGTDDIEGADEEEDADPNAVYCFCRRGIEVGDMIGCDDDRCKFEWFHLVCVGVTTAPEHDQQWFCDECKKRREREAREAALGAGSRRAGAGRRG